MTLTSLVDNVSDMLLLDQGPAKRFGILSTANMPRVPEPFFEGGETVEGLHAEHGFSMLVTVDKGAERYHLVFDTGMTPDGRAGNMRRLAIDPSGVEAVVALRWMQLEECRAEHIDRELDGSFGGAIAGP